MTRVGRSALRGARLGPTKALARIKSLLTAANGRRTPSEHLMEAWLLYFAEHGVLRNTIASVLLLAVLLGLRRVVSRSVQNSSLPDEVRLRSRVQLRSAVLIIWTVGLVVIWATELRTLAISAVAVAAALVLATKELLLCLLGSLLRATSGSYSMGDRIEIVGFRGDVIDLRPLTTTIMEVGPGHRRTGRLIVLPNSLLLSNALRHESFTDEFVLHTITVPVPRETDWQAVEERMLEAAKRLCADYSEQARQHLARSSVRQGLPELSIEPRVYLQAPEHDRLHLVLRLATPARERGRVEQEVLRAALREPIHD